MAKANIIKCIAVASTVLLSSHVMSTQGASLCKGLDSNACDVEAACGWVDGYVRKDGREVSAFCRTSNKGKPKVSKAAETSKKSA